MCESNQPAVFTVVGVRSEFRLGVFCSSLCGVYGHADIDKPFFRSFIVSVAEKSEMHKWKPPGGAMRCTVHGVTSSGARETGFLGYHVVGGGSERWAGGVNT